MNDNEQCEELARDIFIADNSNDPNVANEWAACKDLGGGSGADYAHNIAYLLYAAGYRKPRTITTVEEMDALPEGSVVLDRNGLSLHKQNVLGVWNASNHTWDVQREELESDAFPATVIHEPTTEATK